MDNEKKKGQPLGDRDSRGSGEARPPGAGQEGGLGSYGDQRRDDEQRRNERDNDAPPLDGTITKQDVEGDIDEKQPGPGASLSLWDGPRLSMEARKRQPLIIW